MFNEMQAWIFYLGKSFLWMLLSSYLLSPTKLKAQKIHVFTSFAELLFSFSKIFYTGTKKKQVFKLYSWKLWSVEIFCIYEFLGFEIPDFLFFKLWIIFFSNFIKLWKFSKIHNFSCCSPFHLSTSTRIIYKLTITNVLTFLQSINPFSHL